MPLWLLIILSQLLTVVGIRGDGRITAVFGMTEDIPFGVRRVRSSLLEIILFNSGVDIANIGVTRLCG